MVHFLKNVKYSFHLEVDNKLWYRYREIYLLCRAAERAYWAQGEILTGAPNKMPAAIFYFAELIIHEGCGELLPHFNEYFYKLLGLQPT